MNDASIALQLYTIRDEAERDFAGTVKRVAEIGYKQVEFAGYGGLSASDMAALLADNGLKAISSHVGINALEADSDKEFSYCLTIGSPYLVVPWIGPEWRGAEGLPKLAEKLNTYGKAAHERGLKLGYHNHNFEFEEKVDGKYLLDRLAELTDPQYVVLELDTFWVAYAGVDPVAYLRNHPGRIPLVHLKDMTTDRKFAEVGDGVLPEKEIIAAGRESGATYFIVENDSPSIPSLESVRRSLENLHAF